MLSKDPIQSDIDPVKSTDDLRPEPLAGTMDLPANPGSVMGSHWMNPVGKT